MDPSVYVAPSTFTFVMVGFSWSMLIPLTVVLAMFPAASATDPFTLWPAPFVVRMTSLGRAVPGIPERLSEQVKCPVTGPTYQPFLPTVPAVTAAVMVG